ncbi:primosomal protein N' [Anaeromicrobium sediminis]|uniref:Replication restart protein PriA n=1 Tax=Anaeromicrobium sediminis TaxID=1478221 RepID=A0A267MH09_9FIRM|nr:primosomal protein N' [Anaeromicrobium sediminis]PAB58864.1 primosomal protein N' [Anaeromicrobium sediminis]
MKLFANLIVNNKSKNTDMEYTYEIPDHLADIVQKGSKVIVPFGKINNIIEAYVLDIYENKEAPFKNTKKIKDVVEEDSILTKELIGLCKWMKEKYLCTYMEAIRCVIPRGSSLKIKKEIQLNEENYINYNTNSKIEQHIIDYLKEKGKSTYTNLIKNVKYKSIYEPLKRLENRKIITITEKLIRDAKELSTKIVEIQDINYENLNKRAKKQIEIMDYLKVHKRDTLNNLKKSIGLSNNGPINSLVEKNLIRVYEERKFRTVYDHVDKIKRHVNLTEEQVKAINKVEPFLDKEKYKTFLIHGVTGSGKTEVYVDLINKVLKEGKEAIILVPEISLATQMIRRIKGVFGHVVGILHSRLSLGERLDEWEKIRKGHVKIVIGARSAIFSPFKNLGIIIIDEEHEYSYKSENRPRYHTIEVAKFRAIKNQCPLILGSATPSIEAYYKAINKEYEKIELISRYNKKPLPKVTVVDMREELKMGNKSIFSQALYEELEKNVKNKKQSILFLNRRGHSTFISCRNCGYVLKCPKCDVSLTYHSKKGGVTCHYCGFKTSPPQICPECRSKYIKYFGAGTEKIENMTKKLFPKAKIGRLDLDTTSKKGSMDNILESFKNGEIDILIGTQMVAKGLDFPNVTLVGVIAADISLNIPDFRSSERTFQLITQVAGRAGRGEDEGRVIVQTYSPEHFALQNAQNHDYTSFYNEEILMRKVANYPPYCNIVNIIFSGEDEREIIKVAQDFADRIKLNMNNEKMSSDNEIYGPNPALISKVKLKHRWQLIIKTVDQNLIRGIINYVDTNFRRDERGRVLISIDINPYSML